MKDMSKLEVCLLTRVTGVNKMARPEREVDILVDVCGGWMRLVVGSYSINN